MWGWTWLPPCPWSLYFGNSHRIRMFRVISTRCLPQKQAFLAIKRNDMAKSQQKNESSSCEFKIKFEYRFDTKEAIGKKMGRYYLCYTMWCKIHSTLAWLFVHSRSLQFSTVQCNLNSMSLLRNPCSSHASFTKKEHMEENIWRTRDKATIAKEYHRPRCDLQNKFK